MTTVTHYDDLDVRTISTSDVKAALQRGYEDFTARPTAAIFLIIVYPVIGLVLYRAASDGDLLPLLFPMASGFALVGPLAAVGLYELSRRRELGETGTRPTYLGILPRHAVMPTVLIGLILLAIYIAWLGTARIIYQVTLGDYEPAGLFDLLTHVLSTAEGWTLIAVGCGTGFLFALVVLAVGAISFPAAFDKNLNAAGAMALSLRAFAANPLPMLYWGLIIAIGLLLGSIPAFLGLMVVLPIFGHATWHLYRRLIA